MRKIIKRLAVTCIILIVLIAGGIWWLLSYIAPQQQLDLAYEPIDVKSKVMDMVKRLKPELVLTEDDVNNLIKMTLVYSEGSLAADMPIEGAGTAASIARDIQITGVKFELEGERLIAHLNVMYKDRIPAQLQAVYIMSWDAPNIVLRPQSLKVRDISLPAGMLEQIEIPLDLPSQDILTVREVRFETGKMTISFRLQF